MQMIEIRSALPCARLQNLNGLRNTIRHDRMYLRTKTDDNILNKIRESELMRQKKYLQNIDRSEEQQNISIKTINNEINNQRDTELKLSKIQLKNIREKKTMIQFNSSYKKNERKKIIHRYSMSQNYMQQYPKTNIRVDRKYQIVQQRKRSKSQLGDTLKGRVKLQKMKKFSQSLYLQKYKKYEQLNRAKYKNQKLNILDQQQGKIIKKILQHTIDSKKFSSDLNILVNIFHSIANPEFVIDRHQSQQCKILFTKLLFFIGYQISLLNRNEDDEQQMYERIVSNYHQIYFSMRLNIPLIIMQCYEKLIDISIKACNYVHAQKYAEKCLLASIYSREKYYQERCIEKISMCQYYKGNICEATYLHDNNGQVTQESLKNVRDSYNQQQQLQIVFHHLYNAPRFEVKQILKDYDERMQNYKMLVAFKNPRIDPESSMESKKKQLKVDIRAMQRCKDFKSEVNIIRRQILRHEDLFSVKSMLKSNEYKRLVKQKAVINIENESSQILRAHQSFNRLKNINTSGIKKKLKNQFIQFIYKIINKLH